MRASDDARFFLFWLVCLPVRAVVAYGGFALVKVDDVFYILFSIYTALTSAGFLAFSLLWWCGSARKKGGLGGDVWWNHMRPIHALLWLGACVCFALREPSAFFFLVADVVVGAIAGALHHGFGLEI